jgi:hypothetical protein
VYGGDPPVAGKVFVYDTDTLPSVRDPPGTVRGDIAAATTMPTLDEVANPVKSETFTVILKVPAAVGVPLRTPAVDRLNPAGIPDPVNE